MKRRKSDDRKKRRAGGGSEGKRGVKGKKARGNGGVVRVQRNEISVRQKERKEGSQCLQPAFLQIKYATTENKRYPQLENGSKTTVSSPLNSAKASQTLRLSPIGAAFPQCPKPFSSDLPMGYKDTTGC